MCTVGPIDELNGNSQLLTEPLDAALDDAADVEGSGDAETISYNGVKIEFVPIPTGFVYVQRPSCIFWSTDATADVAKFETGKVANDGDVMFVRSIYTLDATVMSQTKGVLYGG